MAVSLPARARMCLALRVADVCQDVLLLDVAFG